MRKIISALLLLFLTIVILIDYFTSKKEYMQNYHLMLENLEYNQIMADLYDAYSKSNLELVKLINELDGFNLNYTQFYRSKFNDFFSSDTGNILQYIPLYDSITNKRESFILISAGYDGKINNSYSSNDTIFEHDLSKKFHFYNKALFNSYYLLDTTLRFNYINHIFGKKDFIVMYGDMFDYYKRFFPGVIEMKDLENLRLLRVMTKGAIINVKINNYKLTNDRLISRDGYFKIEAQIVSSKITSSNTNDSIYITGRVSNLDLTNHIIELENAVIY